MGFSRLHQTPILNIQGLPPIHAPWVPPTYGSVRETLYVVTQEDLGRPDLIAFKAYGSVSGTQDRWWVILHYNNIADPFSLEVGDKLRIPHWRGFRGNAAAIFTPTSEGVKSIPSLRRPSIPKYVRPVVSAAVAASQSGNGSGSSVRDVTLTNFSFPVPPLPDGKVHFQLQFASDGDFTTIISSKLTHTSIERWFYYDHLANNGAGGHRPFPTLGLDTVTYEGKLVYFQVKELDNLLRGTVYFPRYRAFVDDVDQPWVGAPPILIPNE